MERFWRVHNGWLPLFCWLRHRWRPEDDLPALVHYAECTRCGSRQAWQDARCGGYVPVNFAWLRRKTDRLHGLPGPPPMCRSGIEMPVGDRLPKGQVQP